MELMFRRSGLSRDLRTISALASLQAAGESEKLTAILRLSITNKDDLRTAYEVLLQGYLFCGYPRAIESFFCLHAAVSSKEGLDPANIDPKEMEDSEYSSARGKATAAKVHGSNLERIINKIGAISPDLSYLMIAEGYGHILSREGLDLKARELAVVSSLTATGSDRQLNSHIRGCRNVGCEAEEIHESIFTGVLWLPERKISRAIELLGEITGFKSDHSIDDFFGRGV